mgnify:CR=1 FL=1
MQQLNVVTTQDNDRMFKILTDLIHQDKEFQIMYCHNCLNATEIGRASCRERV